MSRLLDPITTYDPYNPRKLVDVYEVPPAKVVPPKKVVPVKKTATKKGWVEKK
jgi:hypothetical protein